MSGDGSESNPWLVSTAVINNPVYYAVYGNSYTASFVKENNNVSSIGSSSLTCANGYTTDGTTYTGTTCNISLPSITPVSGYGALGWFNSGNTLIGQPGETYTLTASGTFTAKVDILTADKFSYDNSITGSTCTDTQCVIDELGLPTADRFSYSGSGSSCTDVQCRIDELDNGLVREFEFNHAMQTFVAPSDGIYKLEVWGASGGNAGVSDYGYVYSGGRGGYATGLVTLSKGQKLYIVVGAKGGDMVKGSSALGGYNGGGNSPTIPGSELLSPWGAAGGGATHIATAPGLLSTLSNQRDSVLIVAGAGGGANLRRDNYGEGNGGYGGGTTGGNGTSANHTNGDYGLGTGGTQTAGGYYITYTQGGVATNHTGDDYSGGFGYGHGGQSGGGAGWYGGGGSSHGGAGGGSSYIGGLTNGSTIAGNEAMPTYDGTSTMVGNEGDGYAKITYYSH